MARCDLLHVFIENNRANVHTDSYSLTLISRSSRSFTAIRKDAGLYCRSRLRNGEVFAYAGLPHNPKDLKD